MCILSSSRFLTYCWSWWLCRPNYFSIFQSRWWFIRNQYQVGSLFCFRWMRQAYSARYQNIFGKNLNNILTIIMSLVCSVLSATAAILNLTAVTLERWQTHMKNFCYYYHSIFYIERLLLNCHNISLQKRELAPHSLSKRANILAKCIRYIFYTSYPRFVVIVYPYHSRSLCTLGNCR